MWRKWVQNEGRVCKSEHRGSLEGTENTSICLLEKPPKLVLSGCRKYQKPVFNHDLTLWSSITSNQETKSIELHPRKSAKELPSRDSCQYYASKEQLMVGQFYIQNTLKKKSENEDKYRWLWTKTVQTLLDSVYVLPYKTYIRNDARMHRVFWHICVGAFAQGMWNSRLIWNSGPHCSLKYQGRIVALQTHHWTGSSNLTILIFDLFSKKV